MHRLWHLRPRNTPSGWIDLSVSVGALYRGADNKARLALKLSMQVGARDFDVAALAMLADPEAGGLRVALLLKHGARWVDLWTRKEAA